MERYHSFILWSSFGYGLLYAEQPVYLYRRWREQNFLVFSLLFLGVLASTSAGTYLMLHIMATAWLSILSASSGALEYAVPAIIIVGALLSSSLLTVATFLCWPLLPCHRMDPLIDLFKDFILYSFAALLSCQLSFLIVYGCASSKALTQFELNAAMQVYSHKDIAIMLPVVIWMFTLDYKFIDTMRHSGDSKDVPTQMLHVNTRAFGAATILLSTSFWTLFQLLVLGRQAVLG